MTTDKSYASIACEFEHVIEACFPPTISPEEAASLKLMFFAGAAVVHGLLVATPDLADTLKEELLDHADRWQAA